jgi:hypothetical protein
MPDDNAAMALGLKALAVLTQDEQDAFFLALKAQAIEDAAPFIRQQAEDPITLNTMIPFDVQERFRQQVRQEIEAEKKCPECDGLQVIHGNGADNQWVVCPRCAGDYLRQRLRSEWEAELLSGATLDRVVSWLVESGPGNPYQRAEVYGILAKAIERPDGS